MIVYIPAHRRKGLGFQKGLQIFQSVFCVQQLQQYKIYVHPKCMGVKTELQNYSWQKDRQTGEYINKPVDEFNHFLDALRYSLQIIKSGLRTLPKGSL